MKLFKGVQPQVMLSTAAVVLISALAIVLMLGVFSDDSATDDDTAQLDNRAVARELGASNRLLDSGLAIDYTTEPSIALTDVLSGGPGKDGIPALTDPLFEQLSDSSVSDDTQVMVVTHNGETKIYPYSILVWHEIVNDTVGGKPVAVTFCPLCGSAIVFDREIDGEVVDFGVSGFLYQSNLLMYDRSDSESLWSQSIGEAVVGQKTGERLEYFPLELMTFAEAKIAYPNATALSENTGFNRDYTGNPYAGYEDTEETIFPVSVEDKRFPAKEVFYIVPLEGMSIAVRQDKEDGVYSVPDSDITVTFDKGQITANWGEAELPGYYEMWFSWATHNQETGIIL